MQKWDFLLEEVYFSWRFSVLNVDLECRSGIFSYRKYISLGSFSVLNVDLECRSGIFSYRKYISLGSFFVLNVDLECSN